MAASVVVVMEDWQDRVVLLLCIIGFLSISKPLYKSVKWVWSMFLRPPKKLTTYGSWALVTGSANGIGKAFAFELASKGLNLVLVDRDIPQLKSTSNEIWEKFGKGTKIKSIVIDFAKMSGEEIEGEIRRKIEGLDVGVLINNVGLAVEGSRFFHEVDLKGFDSIVSVNIGGVSWVTRAVLPGMLKRKKGAIVNMGSGSSALVPSYPLFAIYAATKAYVAMFSRSLNVEYQQLGIDIQCQTPLIVATKMTSIKRSSFFVPSPNQYSKASMRWIGYDILCVPYWTHSLLCCLIDTVPDSLVNWLLFRYFLNLRKKIIQKESMNTQLKNKN